MTSHPAPAALANGAREEEPAGAPTRGRFPPGIPYIIGNEGCERFSYYGMRAILYTYAVALFMEHGMAQGAARSKATAVTHLFFAGVYAFPMIGAILADRLLGKYPTIVYLSLVYCAGHAALALFEGTEMGLYLGLALIAMGSGGIKPCVSAHVGDQFRPGQRHLVTQIFQAFYWIINFGSFFAKLSIPKIRERFGTSVAFGIPGILMGLATVVFWMGRKKFVAVPPRPGGWLGALDALASIVLFLSFGSLLFTARASTLVQVGVSGACLLLWYVLFTVRRRIQEDAGFATVLLYAVRHQHLRREGMSYFDVARERFGEEAAAGPPAVLRIVRTFLVVSIFWGLFDQLASTWIEQAKQMDRVVSLPYYGRIELLPEQIPALNPLLVMLLIPLMTLVVFPALVRVGLRVTPLRKMTSGMFLAALSFVAVAMLQQRIEAAAVTGEKVSVAWQLGPYVIITVAEVLVSTTGLEFAYTQAPRPMKSTIMGFWSLTVTLGNLLVAFLAPLKELSTVTFFYVFAALMAGAAVIFLVNAMFFKMQDQLQEEPAPR